MSTSTACRTHLINALAATSVPQSVGYLTTPRAATVASPTSPSQARGHPVPSQPLHRPPLLPPGGFGLTTTIPTGSAWSTGTVRHAGASHHRHRFAHSPPAANSDIGRTHSVNALSDSSPPHGIDTRRRPGRPLGHSSHRHLGPRNAPRSASFPIDHHPCTPVPALPTTAARPRQPNRSHYVLT